MITGWRRLLLTLLPTLLLAVSDGLTPPANAAQPADRPAVEWLRLALEARRGVAHHGSLSVIARGREDDAAASLEVSQSSPGRVLMYQSAPRGQAPLEVTESNRWLRVWQDGNVVWEEFLAPPPDPAAQARRVLENYQARVKASPEAIAGRPTVLLILTPNDHSKGIVRLWLDAQTALPLRAHRLTPDGTTVLAHAAYDAVSYRRSPAADRAATELPAHITQPMTLSADQVPSVLGRAASAYAFLPHGFTFDYATVTRLPDGGTRTHVVYGDGLLTLSLFVTRPGLDARPERSLTALAGAGRQSRRLNGRVTQLDTGQPLAVLQWVADGARASLVAALDAPPLLDIAEQVVPPQRYPALTDPLVRAAALLALAALLLAVRAWLRRRG